MTKSQAEIDAELHEKEATRQSWEAVTLKKKLFIISRRDSFLAGATALKEWCEKNAEDRTMPDLYDYEKVVRLSKILEYFEGKEND